MFTMSHSEFIEKPIISKIQNSDIKRICDLGSGYGVWGLLLRIQCDFKGIIDAVDLYAPWLNRISKLKIYNNCYNMNVIDFLNEYKIFENYDLFLCCELIEHLERENGLKLIELLKNADKAIISTPYTETRRLKHNKGFWSGNDLCFHLSGYTPKDFEGYSVETVNINYIPKYFRTVFKVREMLTGKTYSEKNIIAYRGF